MFVGAFIMGNRGRFGKYGEKKRIERLRRSRTLGASKLKGTAPVNRHRAYHRDSTGRREVFTLRAAEPADTEFIRALSREAFSLYGPYEEILPHWFESGITVTAVALSRKRPAGFAMLSLPVPPWHDSRECELLAIAVSGAKQGQGIGDMLLREAEKIAAEMGAGTLVLHTAAGNAPARGLFQSHGFRVREIKCRFYPRGQDAHMMFKDIS
jgi:ribosomal protein S18 acetylase RimI-like enzyme